MPMENAQTIPGQFLAGKLTDVALVYQRVLERDPENSQALVGMSLVALASHQPEAAVKMAAAAVRGAPGMGTAWVTLGQALKACGQLEGAEEAYQAAIRLDGMNPLARLGRGELRLVKERAEEAIVEFELALRRNPALVGAHLGWGSALALLGRDEEALERYRQALSLRPRLPEAEFAAGFVLARLGRVEEAERRYRRALVERPDFAAAWMNLGSLLRNQGREAYAEAALLRAVELRPDLIAGWLNLSLLERERQRPEHAEAYLQKALALNPGQVETHVAWCQFRNGEKDRAGAWKWMYSALALDPNQPEAVNMNGILLHTDGRYLEAVAAFVRAEALGHLAAASNRGNTLLDLGCMDEALRAHQRGVDLDPEHPGARYNLALTQLRLGDWERGWTGYEARWRFREVHRAPRDFAQPRWRGEPLEGRRILLHAEQGLGDTIQFCRYATLVAARGGFPILEVQAPAEGLLRSLALFQCGGAEIVTRGGKLPAFALECPLLSLPAVFETTVDTVPWSGAYLGANAELTERKHAEFPNVALAWPGLRVGIAWAGNPRYRTDVQRSVDLSTLLPLLRMAGVTWISLQKGPAAEQLLGVPQDLFVWNGSSNDADLAETAALMVTLDLVITTDTCIAHLAGAMGKPLWILLPHLGDWRWMQKTERTPWYPSARLIRQDSAGNWAPVVAQVVRDLGAFAVSFRPNPADDQLKPERWALDPLLQATATETGWRGRAP
jgi:tetratricopeptide (TPR) repeat protein